MDIFRSIELATEAKAIEENWQGYERKFQYDEELERMIQEVRLAACEVAKLQD